MNAGSLDHSCQPHITNTTKANVGTVLLALNISQLRYSSYDYRLVSLASQSLIVGSRQNEPRLHRACDWLLETAILPIAVGLDVKGIVNVGPLGKKRIDFPERYIPQRIWLLAVTVGASRRRGVPRRPSRLLSRVASVETCALYASGDAWLDARGVTPICTGSDTHGRLPVAIPASSTQRHRAERRQRRRCD